MTPNDYQQNRVLRRLAKHYPNHVEISELPELDTPETQRVLFYLEEKGLVEPGFISARPGQPREMLQARITALGLDRVKGRDLGQCVVSPLPFETEALRHFIKQSLEIAEFSQSAKQGAVRRLMALSEADMKSLLVKALQRISRRPEDILEIIQNTGTPIVKR